MGQDNCVVLRACEGIMIVSSLEEEDIANLVSCSPACEALVAALTAAFRSVPAAAAPHHVDRLNITWAYVRTLPFSPSLSLSLLFLLPSRYPISL
jgi:hypothetical protein